MKKKLSSAWLLLTNNCNLSCEYCWRTKLHKGNEVKDMSIETADKSVEFLKENGEEGIAITFFGGEPLLRFDLIKYIMQKYPTLNYIVYTNATLLTDEIIDFFHSKRDFIRIVLSIDGKEETNKASRGVTFDEHMVRRVFTEFLEGSVRMTVANPTDCYEDALRLGELGAKKIDICVPRFMKLSSEYYETLESQIEKIKDNPELNQYVKINHEIKVESCKVGIDYVSICPEGNIYPCDIFYWNGSCKLGDIYKGIDEEALETFFRDAIKKSPHSCCVAEEFFFPDVVDYNYSISKWS